MVLRNSVACFSSNVAKETEVYCRQEGRAEGIAAERHPTEPPGRDLRDVTSAERSELSVCWETDMA